MSELKDRKPKERFIPSPGKEVRFVDESGKISTVRMNRAERRRLKIKKFDTAPIL